jgi:hypothetical protein
MWYYYNVYTLSIYNALDGELIINQLSLNIKRWNSMGIKKSLDDLGKLFGKTILKDEKEIDSAKISSTDLFKIILNKLFYEGNYDKAEDLIFDELEKKNSSEVYEIAVEFYNTLLKKNDEELNESNFSREEIYQGLDDIKSFKIDE